MCYASERVENRFRTGRKQVRGTLAKQARSNEVLVLDTRELAPFEIGVNLDVLLCYPTWSAGRRQNIVNAICAELVAYWIELEPDRTAELVAAYPKYRKSKARGALGSLMERHEKALTFGQAFLPLLKEGATGELPILNGEKRELSISEIARFIWPPQENGNEVNYEGRLHDRKKELRNFYPIAHLAAAYQYAARERSATNQPGQLDYQDLEFHRALVTRANEFAGYFRAAQALNAIADQLIQ